MRKLLIILFFLPSLFLLAQQNQNFLSFNGSSKIEYSSNRNIVENGFLYVEIEYFFSGAKIFNKTENGIIYQFINLKDFGKMTNIGKPALPAHTDIILFPSDERPEITILETEVQILEGYNIYPALEPARDTFGAPKPEFEIDNATYNTNEFYPENPVEITDIQYFREAPLGFVQVRPIQFNPVTKQIKVYTKIKYRIEFNGTSRIFSEIAEKNSKNYTDLLKNYVLNNRNIPDGIEHSYNRDDNKNYIIITHSQYLSQANDLAKWKRQLGYSVEVVSQDNWTAVEVKTAIHDRYDLWTPHPGYFVIIGDHTGSYAVPGEIKQTPDDPNDPNDPYDFATDLYYACMNGENDYEPDMAHGRISVSSATEANTVIQKIINYEKNPVTDASFYTNGLNCAMYQDVESNEPADGYAARRFCHTSEEIRDYVISQGYSVDRVYYTDTSWDVTDLHYNNGKFSNGQLLPLELRNTSFDWNGESSDIKAAINLGKFYVFHRDHGYAGGSGWAHPEYTTTSMDNLTNGNMLPVVFSINCHTGEFQLSNCFAEKFIRMSNKGAVGVFAAAYYSFSGWNDGLSCGMIDAIWHDPGLTPDFGSGGVSNPPGSSPTSDIYTMGDVLNQGLIRMVETWNDTLFFNKYTYELFHYFGDPAMKIWTSNPNTNVITASHTNSLLVGSTSLPISGCSCPDGLATLVFNGELIGEVTLISGSGTIMFPALTSEATTATLTISKHNNTPYEAVIHVKKRLTAVEYFFDDDPGFGYGNSITFSPDDSVTVQATIDVSALSVGLHRLHIRAMDETGTWGIPQSKPVLVQMTGPNDPLPDITNIEYFLDDDPDFGNGTSFSFTQDDLVELSANIGVSELDVGLHRLYVRAKDENGVWGIVQSKPVLVQMTGPNDPLPNIVGVEYFIDTEPGIGNGTPFTFTPDTLVTIDTNIPLDSYELGDYIFYVRALDENGIWGIPQYHEFTVAEMLAIPQNVTLISDGTTIIISWDEVPNANSYKIYSSNEPYSGFELDETGEFNGTSWTTSNVNEKRFYYVTAHSDPPVATSRKSKKNIINREHN